MLQDDGWGGLIPEFSVISRGAYEQIIADAKQAGALLPDKQTTTQTDRQTDN